jgi:hypothetical protein
MPNSSEVLLGYFAKKSAECMMSVDEVDPGDDADVGEWLHRTCPYWRAWMYDAWTDSNIRGLRNAVRRWVADCQVQRLFASVLLSHGPTVAFRIAPKKGFPISQVPCFTIYCGTKMLSMDEAMPAGLPGSWLSALDRHPSCVRDDRAAIAQ